MSDYPLIKKLGLDYEETCYPGFGVKLERLLQNATVVYGSIVKHKDEYEWAQDLTEGDTHKALLLAIEPIEQKKVTITRADLERVINKGIEKMIETDDVLDFFAKELGL